MRVSYREQYSEIEQTYLENRNYLRQLEQMSKRSPEERRLKAQRLLVLRAARDTLYDLARQEEGRGELVKPADFGRDPE
ncbi:MAG: hypothetical protein J0H54_06675 [Rhizobiales bacterium]|nr:hypothetical protein [Hyphomicrobiales bacterium]